MNKQPNQQQSDATTELDWFERFGDRRIIGELTVFHAFCLACFAFFAVDVYKAHERQQKAKEATAAVTPEQTVPDPPLNPTDAMVGRWAFQFTYEIKDNDVLPNGTSFHSDAVDFRSDGSFEARACSAFYWGEANDCMWDEFVSKGEWSVLSTEPRVVRIRTETCERLDGDERSPKRSGPLLWSAGDEKIYTIAEGDGTCLVFAEENTRKKYERLSYVAEVPWRLRGGVFERVFSPVVKLDVSNEREKL